MSDLVTDEPDGWISDEASNFVSWRVHDWMIGGGIREWDILGLCDSHMSATLWIL
jgi:hypothetical protein